MDSVSTSSVCPQCLVFSSNIIMDHIVGSIQNILRRTIILLQLNDFSIRVYFLKIKNIADIRSSEFVNRLVIITYNTQITVSLGKKTYQLELGCIRILILVHHNIQETVLIILQYFRACFEQLYRFYNDIIKIQCIILF